MARKKAARFVDAARRFSRRVRKSRSPREPGGIVITFRRTPDGRLRGFLVEGHAGWAPAGYDIVCAAISVLAYTAAGALEDLGGVSGALQEETDGRMVVETPDPDGLPHDRRAVVSTILETFELGCRQVELVYGERVRLRSLSIEPKEVEPR